MQTLSPSCYTDASADLLISRKAVLRLTAKPYSTNNSICVHCHSSCKRQVSLEVRYMHASRTLISSKQSY